MGLGCAAFLLLAYTTPLSYLLITLTSLFVVALCTLAMLATINSCSAAYMIAPALQEAMRMYSFWAVLWALKLGFAIRCLGPALVSAHSALAWSPTRGDAAYTAGPPLKFSNLFSKICFSLETSPQN